jgi:hypothetical protein
MAAKSVRTKLVTNKVRLSFVNVFEPAETLNGVLKYSTMVLIPKSDKEGVARFNKAFEDTKQANAAFFGGSVPKLLKGGLRDGDAEKEDPEFVGHYFFNAYANIDRKPGVVDAEVNPILDKNEVYSGCYGRVSIDLFPYDTAGARGIAVGLNNVQKLEDGERLGGASTSAATDFAA